MPMTTEPSKTAEFSGTMELSHENRLWLDDLRGRIVNKLGATAPEIGDSFPFVSEGGKYKGWHRENPISWWTNSFWSGLMWLMYRETGTESFRAIAESCENQMDEALYNYDGLHHDVGFMWTLTSVASYKLTGNERSRRRAMTAASLLASRYNVKGKFIRAWNDDKTGWAIVDCLMNLPILYWASKEAADERFANVAREHVATAMRAIQRPDGSMNHIVNFDPETGEVVETIGGQGYGVGSSWSRGQAWGLYGFALSHRHTGDPAILDAAKRVAHYFIANVCDDWVPHIDFRAPAESTAKDSTAGAIAAAGLLEIADSVPELGKGLYRGAAIKMLKALDRDCGAWGLDEQGLLLHGSHAYHRDGNDMPNDRPIIYGDYYFVEAVLRLCGRKELFW